jgi:hypothetical protein
MHCAQLFDEGKSVFFFSGRWTERIAWPLTGVLEPAQRGQNGMCEHV